MLPKNLKLSHINIIISILLVVGFLSMFFLFRSGNECLSNPLVYGARQITNEDNNVICSCSLIGDNSQTPFFFDKNNLSIGPS